MKICLLYLCLCVFAFCADYPLKSIGIALSKPEQVAKIPTLSKNLLESTSGIKNYQNGISPTFKAKLQTRENLIIRILGDSHIAGDFISHRLRGLMFEEYTFGLVYPLFPAYHQHIALKYESSNFEVLNYRDNELDEYPLGGIVAKPIELPAHITLSPQNTTEQTLSKIIFKSTNQNSALVIEDSAKQQFIINAKHPFVWQILTLKLRYPITIHALNEKVLLGGLFISNEEGANNIIENLGINGAKADIWLKWDKELFMQQMRILPADLYILCYGSNDALYSNFNEALFLKNYGNLIDTIKAANPNANILLLSPPPVVQKVSNATKRKKAVYKLTKNANPVKTAIVKLAQEKQIMLFSMEDFINESGGKAKWESANLAKPDVHLLPNGYRLIADKLYYELMKLE